MTNNLNITQLSASQNNKEVTVNDANGELDAALTAKLNVAVDDTNAATITVAQLRRANIVSINPDGTPPDAAITITFDAFSRGTFALRNTTAQDVTATIASQPETAPVIPAGETHTLTMDGTNVLSAGGGSSSSSLEIEDEGSSVGTPSVLNFVGSGVAVSDAGGGTFDVTVSGGSGSVVTLPDFMGASVRKASDQTGANYSTEASIAWDSEIFDTNGFHDNATNNSRLTIPAGLGIKKVIVTLALRMDFVASGTDWYYRLNKNGVNIFDGAAMQTVEQSGVSYAATTVTTGPIEVSDGDYFEARFFSGADTSVDIVADNSHFDIMVVEVEGGVHVHPVTEETGTSYTFGLGDIGAIVRLNNAAAITATVPPNSTTAFPIGTTINPAQWGAGTVTFAPGAGVTIRSRGGLLDLAGQYAAASLIKIDTNEWLLSGDLA